MRDKLVELRNLLSTHDKWVKGVDARDSKGGAVARASPAAVSFCLVSACYAVMPFGGQPALVQALGFWDGGHAIAWNDRPNRTHAEVLARIDGAIACLFTV